MSAEPIARGCPCLTCGWATPTEITQIPFAQMMAGDTQNQSRSMALRCDWRPEGETARWFTPGQRLCDLHKPDPCDAWKPGDTYSEDPTDV